MMRMSRVFVGLLAAVVIWQLARSASEGQDKAEKVLPMEELMEEVQNVNKALLKPSRTKAAFDAVDKDSLAKDCEKMAELTKQIVAHAPKKDEPGKTIKQWKDSSEGVRKACLEMAKAAKDKNQPEYRAAFKRMDAACTSCHEVFRD